MTLKSTVRDVINRNALAHRWFVGFCAKFSMRLFHLQSFLSLEDLRAKRRAALWRKCLTILSRPSLEKVVIANGRATFCYRDGCAFHASPSRTSISGGQFTHGDYEAVETAVMEDLVKPGWTAIDAGANYGWHAIHLAKWVGAEGRVYAFEPVPASFQELAENIELNRCRNLKAYDLALGNQEGQIPMMVPAIPLGAGAASQFLDMGEKFLVPVQKLDDFLDRQGIDRVDFLKADIEGGELNLLRGAVNLLSRLRPTILLEIVDIHCRRFGHTPRNVVEFLTEHGYSGKFIGDQGIFRNFDASAPPNGNYLFVPPA